jgi:subtilisin family serine protease
MKVLDLFHTPLMLLLAGIWGAWIPVASAAPPPFKTAHLEAPDAHPDYWLVGFRRGTGEAARRSAHAAAGAERVRSFRRIPVDVVRMAPGTRRKDIQKAYQSRKDVAYIEPNYRVTKKIVPNDPLFGDLWGLRNTGQTGGTPGADINVSDVWETHGTGSRDILVAIIDTGIDYTHEDLVANLWTNPDETANGLDDDGNGIEDDIHGARWIDGNGQPTSGDPMDGDGHGTHVAGTIGGVGDNGTGVAGVNWQVRLMALKFLDDEGSGWSADAVAALEYAIDKGAHLSNNSWGGGGYSQAMRDMIAAAGDANQLFIAAAGNSATDNDSIPHYPSSYDNDNIIAAASSDQDDLASSFSCYGWESVDLAAPGSGILSSVPGDDYDEYSGTSMATPHVTGAAALLWSFHPGAPWTEVKDWLLQGARRLPAWNGLTVSGGRLNVAEGARLASLPEEVAPVGALSAASHEGDTSNFLTWANPPSVGGWIYTDTTIRRDTENFPSRWDEGELVYAGGAEDVEDSAVDVGQRYFYTAWARFDDGATSLYSAPAFAQARAGGEPDDYFTELFSANDNDLAHSTVLLVPEASLNGYHAFTDPAEGFFTDPAGGTPLPPGDDSPVFVELADGQTVWLYGVAYDHLHVGPNGFITFGESDSTWTESLAAHFRLPRVSALFDDLNPSFGGEVLWEQLADRVAVTWLEVPEFGNNNRNSFQIEMFFDGRIRLTWLQIDARDGLAGLSAGDGIPFQFVESDLSDYPSSDPLRVTPRSGFHPAGIEGGPFSPDSTTYELLNDDAAPLDWSLVSAPGWLQVVPAAGTLAPAASVDVDVSLDPGALALAYGYYTGNIVFSNHVSGRIHTRQASLSVTREGFSALFFADGFVGPDFVTPALRAQGYAVELPDTWEVFNQALMDEEFLLVVSLAQASDSGLDLGALEDHLLANGRVIAADWQQDEMLAELLEAEFTGVDDMTPVTMTDDDLAAGIQNPQPIADPGWGAWWSFGLRPLDAAQSIARFRNGDSALVWGHGGRSALLGMLADTLAPEDGQRFFENLLQLLEVGHDDLLVLPADGFSSAGYQLGPFAPENKSYTLSNTGADALDWTAAATSTWAEVSLTAGNLAPGAEVMITVQINASAVSLDPGTYRDILIIENTTSGKRFYRDLQLTVIPLPGEIQVTDSLVPEDDLQMPFGEWIVGQSTTEQITIHNVDALYDLVISGTYILSSLGDAGPEAFPVPPAKPAAARRSPVKTQSDPDVHDWVPDTLLIGFKSDADTATRDAVHAALGARRVHRYSRIPVDVAALPKNSDLKAFIAAYQSQSGVAYAEPNYIIRLSAIPDDPRFGDLWGLHNTGQTGGTPGADIRATAAWDITTGSRAVIVGIIDTGIDYTHPDLIDNLWVNPDETENGLDDDGNGIMDDLYGARWIDGTGMPTSGDPMDGNNHGTHVAGTIGGVGHNAIGVAGINWQVRLMGLKFLDDSGSGATADAISAIEYAIDKGAHLSNNSWGGGGYSQALRDMIEAAGEANQLFIAAAGNDGTDNDTLPHYPSTYDNENIIAVASSDHNDARSSFSCFGLTTVDLAAPGSSILSTVPGGDYDTFSGTSMASPHVAGVAALLYSMAPTAPYDLIKQALLDSVDVLPAWDNLTVTGGRLNAFAALQRVNLDFSLEGLSPLPIVIPPGGSTTFDVVYRPSEAGDHQSWVRIISNDTNVPTVHVALTGSAVNDALELSPDEPFHAEGAPGGPFVPASKAYDLTNTGEVPVTWSALSSAAWLDLVPAGGTIQPGASMAIAAELAPEADALPGGTYSATLTFSNHLSGVIITRTARLVIEIPLCDAVDACELTWTTGGNAPWFTQTATTHDGIDAAQSGPIGDSQESWMQTTVEGPGNLSFWWKVSSEGGFDFLEFHLNDVLQSRTSGNVDWHEMNYRIPAGTHTLRWVYAKDSSVSADADCGWVDQVSFTASIPTDAYDHAGNYTPGTFSNRSNGGTGYLPWTLITDAGATALLDSSTNGSGDIDSANGYSFRFMGGPGETYVDAFRPFAHPLEPGDVFHATLAFNWNGGARGICLLAADGTELFNINFRSGDILSFKWGNDSGVDFPPIYSPAAVLQVAVSQLADSQLHVAFTHSLGLETNFTSSGLTAPAAEVKFYNGGHTGDNVNYALYVNNLIIQRNPEGDQDGDGLPDWWEERFYGNPTAANADAMAANHVHTVMQTFIADLDPTDPAARFAPAVIQAAAGGGLQVCIRPTSTARLYRVEWSADLLEQPQNWTLFPPEKTGTEDGLLFDVETDEPHRTYRTGVRLP